MAPQIDGGWEMIIYVISEHLGNFWGTKYAGSLPHSLNQNKFQREQRCYETKKKKVLEKKNETLYLLQ